MKFLILAIVFIIFSLFLLTTFLPSPEAASKALDAGFTEIEIADGQKLAFQRDLIFWSSTFIKLGFFLWIVFSGQARKLADQFDRWTGNRWVLTTLLMGAFCFLVPLILRFPISVISLENWRAWGMTERSLLDWLTDYGKAVALSGGIGAVLVIGFYALMRWFPKWWWVLAAVALTGFGIVYALVLPIVIDPIFNTFEPLHDEQLRERIQILADRAGVPIQEVYVMDASRRGKHTNAYFTGFGPTRQIVLYDTLVANHPPEELEIILAHEMGHWMHHHIYIGLALGSLGAFVGFYLLRLILRRAVHQPALQLRSPADPAGLPLIMLLVFLGSWLILPLENGISRHFETQADMASLNLTENPKVFIDTERRLARDNKANVAPSPLSVWVFNTHPPVVERIQLAKDWQKEMR